MSQKSARAAHATLTPTSSEKAVPLALFYAATSIRTAVPLVFGPFVPRHFRPGRRLTKKQPCGQTQELFPFLFYTVSD